MAKNICFLADLVDKKHRSKIYIFYMDDEAVAALEELAKQKKKQEQSSQHLATQFFAVIIRI